MLRAGVGSRRLRSRQWAMGWTRGRRRMIASSTSTSRQVLLHQDDLLLLLSPPPPSSISLARTTTRTISKRSRCLPPALPRPFPLPLLARLPRLLLSHQSPRRYLNLRTPPRRRRLHGGRLWRACCTRTMMTRTTTWKWWKQQRFLRPHGQSRARPHPRTPPFDDRRSPVLLLAHLRPTLPHSRPLPAFPPQRLRLRPSSFATLPRKVRQPQPSSSKLPPLLPRMRQQMKEASCRSPRRCALRSSGRRLMLGARRSR